MCDHLINIEQVPVTNSRAKLVCSIIRPCVILNDIYEMFHFSWLSLPETLSTLLTAHISFCYHGAVKDKNAKIMDYGCVIINDIHRSAV